MNVLRSQMFDLDIWHRNEDLNDAGQCGALPELHDGPDNPDSESYEERAAREEVARQLCEECPGRLFCLDFAVRVQPQRGIWAGFTAEEIDALSLLTLGEAA